MCMAPNQNAFRWSTVSIMNDSVAWYKPRGWSGNTYNNK